MPTDPIRRTIVTAIRDRLAAITMGTTYFYTPRDVGTQLKGFNEVAGFPAYCVIGGDEQPSELTNAEITERLTVHLVVWVSDDKDRHLMLDRALADVKRALYVDNDLAGLVLSLTPGPTRTDESALFARPIAYGEIDVLVEYDHARRDV